MLKPTFSERTAMEIQMRIITWLQNHFITRANWELYGPSNGPADAFEYQYPSVRDFAESGDFDDIADSVFLRVLKDMNNFGKLTLTRHPVEPTLANSQVILSNRMLNVPPSAWECSGTFHISKTAALEILK